MNRSLIIGVLSGGLIGSIIGYFVGKAVTVEIAKKEANQYADEEIERMQKYYERKFAGPIDDDSESNQRVSNGAQESDNSTRRPGQEHESKTSGNHGRNVDYTKFYKKGSAKTGIEYEEESDPTAEYDGSTTEEEEIDRETADVEREDEERRLNKNRPPKIISEDQLDDIPGYVTTSVLYYYPDTDVIMDEEDHIVGEEGEYGQFLGTTIQDSGFDEDEDERLLYVRNFELDALYEIQKMDGDDPITESAINLVY